MPNVSDCGLYVIRHTASGRSYYGSSINIPFRWKQHRTDLNCGRHANGHLQNAWRKHGAAAFTFAVLCVLERDDLKAAEQALLAQVVGDRDCYNIARDAVACMRGQRHTSAARAKISEAGRKRPYNPETFRKVAEKLRGRPLSPEHREKLAAAKRGKCQSPEAIAKRVAKTIGRKRPQSVVDAVSAAHRGAKRSPESRAKMSAARKGKPLNLTPEAKAARTAHLTRINQNRSPEHTARLVASRRRNRLSDA